MFPPWRYLYVDSPLRLLPPRGLCDATLRKQPPHEHKPYCRPNELRRDESGSRGGSDSRERVAEHPTDRDGGVRKARGAREEIGAADVGADGDRCEVRATRAHESEDHDDESGGRHDLAEKVTWREAHSGAERDGSLPEHEVREDRADDASDNLGGDVQRGVAPRPQPAERIDDRDHRIEVCAADRHEHENEYSEAECRGESVLEQLQTDVAGRELLGGDPGADHDRGEARASEEFCGQTSGEGKGAGRGHWPIIPTRVERLVNTACRWRAWLRVNAS